MAERLWFLKVIYLIILSLPSLLRGQNKELKFNDPGLKDQWYLGKNAADDRHNNIWSAWQQGATGKGVRIALIDNGVEVTHNDLLDNIVTESSFNYGDFNRDLQPRKTRTPGHGTKMAGIIGMSANNNQCGVGIAYEAKISALTFGWTALAHAQSYTHRLNETDIYVSTTGPPDNGQFIAKHTKQVMKAYVKGITKGRRGLGSIYIRTSGSGGYHGDHCGADGTVNNLYSIAVASAAKDHSQTLLGEGCASILTSVYTQQTKWFVKGFTKDVITTDLRGSCTINSGGSSTAAAMVSAIVALALSVNQQLTWRDVQYLIIKSSNQNNLPVTWYTNSVGLRFNSRYGFGILDAGKMVTLSKTWKTTGVIMVSQKVLVTKSMALTSLKKNELINLPIKITKSNIKCLEHVSLLTSIRFTKRGQIALYLTSPSGTVTELLGYRYKDTSRRWFSRWRFTSVHFWGEKPLGKWLVQIVLNGAGIGQVRRMFIELFGSSNDETCKTFA